MDDHKLDNETQMEVNGKWIPVIPYPYFTTRGLPLWKWFSEKYWRPQCTCKRIFNTLEDYNAHIVYVNSPYAELSSKEKEEK